MSGKVSMKICFNFRYKKINAKGIEIMKFKVKTPKGLEVEVDINATLITTIVNFFLNQ